MSRLLPPKHLLVRVPNPIGDAVMATPALRALRRALPSTRITWAGRRAALEALAGLAWRDGVLPVAGPFCRGKLAPIRAGRMWRRAGPDAVLLLPNALSSVIAARVCGARVRVGSGVGGGGSLLTHRVSLPMEGTSLRPRPMTAMYMDLAAPFGAVVDGRGTEVVATPFDRRRAARRLERPTTYFVVNPGAAFGPSKVYPPRHLGRAARIIRDRTGHTPLVVCGPGEEELAHETAQAVGEPCLTTHRAPPDIGELKALLEGALLVLTTDAGPRHLAEALGRPTVVVMGPTDPLWSGDSKATILRKEGLDCLACHEAHCPIQHPCMETLDPDDVAEAAIRALATRGLGRG